MCVDLPFGGAVDALVGDVGSPPLQVFIDLCQTLKILAFQGVVFDVFDTGLDFALVGGPVRPGRHDERTIVLGKDAQLRVEFGFIPVRLDHSSLEVVRALAVEGLRQSDGMRSPGSAGSSR